MARPSRSRRGHDIWGTSGEFHYAYRAMTGDGQIVAPVASLQAIELWTKAGVMMRETLTAGSKHAHMLVSRDIDLVAEPHDDAIGGDAPTPEDFYWFAVEGMVTVVNGRGRRFVSSVRIR